MTITVTDGSPPDRGPAPAYRLAPDTPAEIAADLARLCAGPGQTVPATGVPMSADSGVVGTVRKTPDTARATDARVDEGVCVTVAQNPARAGDTAPPARGANGLAPALAAESTASARGRAVDAQADGGVCRTVRRTPADAPRSAGRRLALFGAAAALLAPPLARSAAARVAEADAELARLADEIDRTLDGAAYALEPVDDEDAQNRRLRHAADLMLLMVDVSAVGLAGVKAKAKGYLDTLSYDVLESAALAQSLAEDAERVCGGVTA